MPKIKIKAPNRVKQAIKKKGKVVVIPKKTKKYKIKKGQTLAKNKPKKLKS